MGFRTEITTSFEEPLWIKLTETHRKVKVPTGTKNGSEQENHIYRRFFRKTKKNKETQFEDILTDTL